MAYGARLESVLSESSQGFESPILRQNIVTGAPRPRLVTEAELADADVVVVMKPGLALPGAVGGRLVEWEFPNPEEWDLDGVRGMRDAVAAQVRALAAELDSSS